VLSLSEPQLKQIALIVMGAIPGFVALFGLVNWLQRRS
jgi:nitrate reductase gamma subunit